jgi:hypothetical protein
MAPLTGRQADALRELLGGRTLPETAPKARALDQALNLGDLLNLTPADYDTQLVAIVRLRLRRGLLRALDGGTINAPAAAQILGFVGHNAATVSLEDLLDPGKFPNLTSPDFAFLRELKQALREDVEKLKSAAR